jgi:hypothetical protein
VAHSTARRHHDRALPAGLADADHAADRDSSAVTDPTAWRPADRDTHANAAGDGYGHTAANRHGYPANQHSDGHDRAANHYDGSANRHDAIGTPGHCRADGRAAHTHAYADTLKISVVSSQ